MRDLKINNPIGGEIITPNDVKNYVRIDTDFDDSLITYLIIAARIQAESYISRDIVAKSRTYFLSEVGACQQFALPFPPIDEIVSVKSGDKDLEYDKIGLEDIHIKLKERVDIKNVTIVYTTLGMNTEALRVGILQIVSTNYDNRSDFVSNKVQVNMCNSATMILNPHKLLYI